MSPLLRELLQASPERTALGRYVIGGGCFYLLFGLGLMVWPGQLQTIFRERPFVGHEEGLVRVLALVLAVIGWLHVFIGRVQSRPLVAATVVDRLLVPLLLVPLAIGGVFPVPLMIFAVLDPTLAVIAWILLAKDRRAR